MRCWRTVFAVLGLAALAAAGCGPDRQRTVLKLGHGMDPTHPVSRAMQHMAERVDSASGGRLQVDIYPSEQLGTERQCLELLQIGSLDMTKVSSSVLEGFSSDYRVFGMPYVFRDEAHRFAVLEGEIGREILLSSRGDWLRGLVYYDAGSRSFYTTERPVRTPADLEGLKVRVQQSPAAIELVRTMGGSPTPISFGELYSALQQGVVDAAENNPPSFHTTRHYELCDYYTLDQHTAPPDVLIVSTHTWDRLSEQERAWLQEAARASAQLQKRLWDRAVEEAMQAVEDAGVTVIRPDKSTFVEAVQPMYASYRQNQPEVYRLFERIRALETK
jgi:tripartite ATP-independent transporter DctP family solute receptor